MGKEKVTVLVWDRSIPQKLILRFWNQQGPVEKVVGWLLLLFLFPPIGLGLLYIGSGKVIVRCHPSQTTFDCLVEEKMALNLYTHRRWARNVVSAELSSQEGSDGEQLTGPVLISKEGRTNILTGVSNVQNRQKHELVRDINNKLKKGPFRFSSKMDRWNIFGYIGLPVFLLAMGMVLSGLIHLLFPRFIEIDRKSRSIRYRLKTWQVFAQRTGLSEVRGFSIGQKWFQPALVIHVPGEQIRFINGYPMKPEELKRAVDELNGVLGKDSVDAASHSSPADGDGPPFLSNLVKQPDLTRLPIRIRRGSQGLRGIGVVVVFLSLVFFTFEIRDVFASGDFDLALVMFPLFFAGLGLRLLQIEVVRIDKERVQYKKDYLLFSRSRREWLVSFSGISIEEHEGDEDTKGPRFYLFLKHKSYPAQDISLLNFPLQDETRAMSMAQDLAALLSLPVLPRGETLCEEDLKVDLGEVPSGIVMKKRTSGETELSLIGVKNRGPFVVFSLFFIFISLLTLGFGVKALLEGQWGAGLLVLLFGTLFLAFPCFLLWALFRAEHRLVLGDSRLQDLGILGPFRKHVGEIRREDLIRIELVDVKVQKGKGKRLIRIYGKKGKIDYGENASEEELQWILHFLKNLYQL